MNYKQSDSKKSKLRIFKKKKVDGIQQGQESEELLGYRFERGLHKKKRKDKKKRV